jgi:integrase
VTIPIVTSKGKGRKRVAKSLGFVNEITRKEAMQRRTEILQVANAGRILAQSQVRFKEVAEFFLSSRVPQLGSATHAKYQTQLVRHILPAFGELRMCDIDAPTVEAWLNTKAADGLGWWSRVDLKAILSAIFTAARNWKLWVGDNPTEGVRIGKKSYVREKRLLTTEQAQKILNALTGRERLLVHALAGIGLRISEALGLRWADIDFDEGRIHKKLDTST